jgi:uncharacterized protein
MAGSSLFALIDDIATLLDDVSVMTKVAAKKTAGVLGDDLALNAQQVTGIQADRELPVVWAVAKGSLVNKAILVPAALAISAWIPWLITPLLMLGGAFLCFEGMEKIAHKWLHDAKEDESHHAELVQAVSNPDIDIVAFEKEKVKGAIRTDFILSAEIIVISLGTVAAASFTQQVTVLVGISLIMTVGVYGLVAGIVKLDDAGLYLTQRKGSGAMTGMLHRLGRVLLAAAPQLMKALSVLGTIAMFLVGGSIVAHGLPGYHEAMHHLGDVLSPVPGVGGVLASMGPMVAELLVGLLVGAAVLVAVTLGGRVWKAASGK